jgi:hypothetical protein
MFNVLQILTAILIAVAMARALAHALEFPGKMRLTKETYFAMQPIYYPGFTIGGGIGEFGSLIILADASGIAWTGRDASCLLASDTPSQPVLA